MNLAGGLVLDPRTRVLHGGRVLVGGDPWRVLRLTEDGAAVLGGLLVGEVEAAGGGAAPGGAAGGAAPALAAPAAALARRLVQAGLAHPRPSPSGCEEVTVVIPVRDRATELERCLAALVAGEVPAQVIVVDDGSDDSAAVASVCAHHGCELIRRERPGGPAVARNAALGRVRSGLVALLDSDCVPSPGWLSTLYAALAADPGLGAVAPRVRPLAVLGPGGGGGELYRRSGPKRFPATGALARFASVRSPLDLGPWPSLVRPGGRTGYVPTAALLLRREALGERAAPFEPALRYGEDVDLIWRMIDQGWSVRYEPAAVVWHGEPERLRPWLARRFRYGSSAGPLARRHPERLAPVMIRPRTAATLGAATVALSSRRSPSPAVAAIPIALHVALVTRSLGRHGVPPRTAARLALQGLGESGAALGRSATMLGSGALGAALVDPRTRRPALALLLASPVRDVVRLRPPLDPLRFAALSIADDAAYGAGVWAGALRARTLQPLRPRIVKGGVSSERRSATLR